VALGQDLDEPGFGGAGVDAVFYAHGQAFQVILAGDAAHGAGIGHPHAQRAVVAEAAFLLFGDADDAAGHIADEQDLTDGRLVGKEFFLAVVVDDDFLRELLDAFGIKESPLSEFQAAHAEVLLSDAGNLRADGLIAVTHHRAR